MSRIYDLFVSGGKDSVVAATIAYEEARQAGIPVRVVFINELPAFRIPAEILPFDPLDYVKTFSEWLGVDLVVIDVDFDYWEGVKKWGYPLLFNKRWCYDKMKVRALTKFVEQEIREGYSRRTWVLGIRVSESRRRAKIWGSVRKRYTYWFQGYQVEYYLPILDWGEKQVESFIKERGIPENPAWRFGWSFECLCMAGTTIKKLDEIIAEAPELAKWLAEKDREVQAARSGPAYPAPLLDRRMTLSEYVDKKFRQPKLTHYMR